MRPLTQLAAEARGLGRERFLARYTHPFLVLSTPTPDERWFSKWAHDPWAPVSGHEGRVLDDGAAYLLAWAMGRYHGFIGD